MDLVIAVLISWLATNHNIEITEYPLVLVSTSEELSQRYGASVWALYEHHSRTMYVRDDVDIETEWGRSVLIHELVHHYQNVSGVRKTYECTNQSERLAYTVQKDYLIDKKQTPSKLFSDFNIAMQSVCSLM